MGAGKIIVSIIVLVFSIVLIISGSESLLHQTKMINGNVQQTNNQIEQLKSKINEQTLNYITTCENAYSIGDLTNCKEVFNEVKNECSNSQVSSMPVCNDPRIDQILSTVDGKIASTQTQIASLGSKLSDTISQAISLCSQANDVNTLSTCQTEMLQIKQECSTYTNIPTCSDSRIDQIINKQITPPSNLSDAASQNMETFIGICMLNMTEDCKQKASQMIQLCQNSNAQACSDPRLQQIANQNTNPVVQTTPSPTPELITPTCPTFSTQNAIVVKGSTGNSLFSPQSLNLRGGDYVIFKSSDGKPHLLTSDNDSLRDWFLKNGALINNDQNVKLPITIFGNAENFLNVFDSYEPNISITLDVKPTPTECSK